MRFICLVCALLITSASLASDPRAAATGTMKFTRLGIKDPGINSIEAISFLIPTGWKTEGGIQWFPDYSILANLLMKVTDPQTGAQVEFLPIQNFTWLNNPVVPMQPGQNYLGNIVYQPVKDVPRFVQTFYMPKALAHLRNARPIAKEDLTKVAELVKRNYGERENARACSGTLALCHAFNSTTSSISMP